MEKYFEIQLAACPGGSVGFVVYFLLKKSNGRFESNATISEHVKNLGEKYIFLKMMGSLPMLKLRDDI